MTARRRAVAAAIGVAAWACSAAATGAAAKEPADSVEPAVKSGPAAYVPPVRVEAGPVLAPPLSATPRTEMRAAFGYAFARSARGRARYQTHGVRVVLGGDWRPRSLPALAVGGELIALQVTAIRTEVPPAIDELATCADLGPLRVRARYLALERERGPFSFLVTPLLSLGLPTGTDRIRPRRRMPIRRVIDDRVFDGPPFVIEPGVTGAVLLGPLSAHAAQSALLVPVHEQAFHFAWSSHLGLGIRLFGRLALVVDWAVLARATRDFAGRRLAAQSLDPGVRVRVGDLEIEAGAKIGLGEHADAPYGDLTALAGVVWTP